MFEWASSFLFFGPDPKVVREEIKAVFGAKTIEHLLLYGPILPTSLSDAYKNWQRQLADCRKLESELKALVEQAPLDSASVRCRRRYKLQVAQLNMQYKESIGSLKRVAAVLLDVIGPGPDAHELSA